jgi:hypothetical protein
MGFTVVDRRGVPRFWASIWSDVLKARLKDGTRRRRLADLDRLYLAAERQLGYQMTDKTPRLKELLEIMLLDDEKITARAVVRRSHGLFKNATDITRIERRKAMVGDYADRQSKIRVSIEGSSKLSRKTVERQLATKNAEIERLNGQIELLIASHKSVILAISEMGGFSTWKRFFDRYQEAEDALEAMGAMPSAELVTIPEQRQAMAFKRQGITPTKSRRPSRMPGQDKKI